MQGPSSPVKSDACLSFQFAHCLLNLFLRFDVDGLLIENLTDQLCNFPLLSRFLYSDEVQIGPETVMTTLYTAKKYAVPALEAHCVEFLTKHLRADNAFMLLTQVSPCD